MNNQSVYSSNAISTVTYVAKTHVSTRLKAIYSTAFWMHCTTRQGPSHTDFFVSELCGQGTFVIRHERGRQSTCLTVTKSEIHCASMAYLEQEIQRCV